MDLTLFYRLRPVRVIENTTGNESNYKAKKEVLEHNQEIS